MSPYGIRSISRYHAEHPYVLDTGQYGRMEVQYAPAESSTGAFGGNSNWRGPIWFPINYLLVEALQRYHSFYGDDFLIECPTGSGTLMNLAQVSDELARRLTGIFLRNEQGDRPVFGGNRLFQKDPLWRDHIPFYEYFHGESGAGIGASHQTGWTALIANLLEQTSPDAAAASRSRRIGRRGKSVDTGSWRLVADVRTREERIPCVSVIEGLVITGKKK